MGLDFELRGVDLAEDGCGEWEAEARLGVSRPKGYGG